MELVDAAVNGFVVGAMGFLLYLANRGTRKELAEALAELRTENRQDHTDIRREIGEVRSDLVRVALAVGSEPAAPPPH